MHMYTCKKILEIEFTILELKCFSKNNAFENSEIKSRVYTEFTECVFKMNVNDIRGTCTCMLYFLVMNWRLTENMMGVTLKNVTIQLANLAFNIYMYVQTCLA